jgi:hypothetical protein
MGQSASSSGKARLLMNTYRIEHKIRTLAEIWSEEPFSHGGYEFRQWGFGGSSFRPQGQAWIAKREMCATSWMEAINTFRADLFRIVDRIAAVSQCHTMASAESFLVLRKNDNPERIFLLRYSQARQPVPLAFNEQSVEALDKLDALGDKLHALEYLREATASTTFLTRIVMLLATLEALAGEKPPIGNRRMTDTDFIKNEILKDDALYNRLYVSGTRLRHAIMHGHKLDLTEDVHFGIDYVERVYTAIVRYLNDRFDLTINTKVIGPQRTPYGNYELTETWLRPLAQNEMVELKSICERLAPTEGYLRYPYQDVQGMRYANEPDDY